MCLVCVEEKAAWKLFKMLDEEFWRIKNVKIIDIFCWFIFNT